MFDFLFIFLGISVGFLLGLIPGAHINNLLPFMAFLPFADTPLIFFIISMSVAFVFSSFFPSVLLGVPNEETSLSVLPGHRLVRQGQGYTALLLLIYGGLFAIFLSAIFLMPLAFFAPLFPYFDFFVPFLLVLTVMYLLFTSRKNAVPVVALSSCLGFLTFNYNLLFPLLSGFFAMSTLIVSVKDNPKQICQKQIFEPELSCFSMLRASTLSCFLASFFNIIPAVSSSIVASIANIFGKLKEQEFLVLIGSTNVTYMVLSFFFFALFAKTRSGSAVFLSRFGAENVLFMTGICLIAGILSAAMAIKLAKKAVRIYQKINIRFLTIFSILFLISVNAIFTGFFGVLVLFAATSIGLLCASLNVPRINCMVALIVPTAWVLL
jgi:putative membrane protein